MAHRFPVFTAEEVHESCLAMRAFDSSATLLPDPIGLRDLSSADFAQIRTVLADRIAEERMPRSRHVERYPKDFDREHYRVLSGFDLLDQIGLRICVAPIVAGLDERLPDGVVAHRYESQGRGFGWAQRSLSVGAKARREILEPELLRSPHLWMAVADVRDFFSSVSQSLALSMLSSLGFDDVNLAPVEWVLSELGQLPGVVKGLPIGPEFSGVLGTVALVALDRQLRGSTFARFVDDVWVLADSEPGAEEVLRRLGDQLTRMGLALNLNKSRVLTRDDALSLIRDPVLDYLFAPGASVSEAAAMGVFDASIAEESLTKFRGSLSALSRCGSLYPLELALTDLQLLDIDPRAFGRYMHSVSPRLDAAQIAALVSFVVSTSADHSLAARSMVAAALGLAPISKADADRLIDLVGARSDRKTARVRTHALATACKHSPRIRGALGRCFEAVEQGDSLDEARTVAFFAKHDCRGRATKAALRHLCRVRPEVVGFAAGTLAAC